MWSLGVILYILLSGGPPFDHSKGMDAINDGISFTGNAWDEISNEATDLISSLLEKNPKQRISITEACSHSWILTKDGDSHEHPLDDPSLPKQNQKHKNQSSTSVVGGKLGFDGTSSPTPEIRIRECLNERNEKKDLKSPCSSPSQNANLPTPRDQVFATSKHNPRLKRVSLLSVVKQLSNGSNGGSMGKEQTDKHKKTLQDEDSFVDSQSSEVVVNNTQDDQEENLSTSLSVISDAGFDLKTLAKEKIEVTLRENQSLMKGGKKPEKSRPQAGDAPKGKQATLSNWILKE